MLSRYHDILVQHLEWCTRFVRFKAICDHEKGISFILSTFGLYINIFPQLILSVFLLFAFLKISTFPMITLLSYMIYKIGSSRLFFRTGETLKYIQNNLWFYEQLVLEEEITGGWEIQLWGTACGHARANKERRTFYGSCRPDGPCGQRRYSSRVFDAGPQREIPRLFAFRYVIPHVRTSRGTMVRFSQKSFSSWVRTRLYNRFSE